MTETPATPTQGKVPLSPYQKKLLFFLSIATFFEGFDFMALSQLLPELRSSMNISVMGGTAMVAFINFGTMIAYLLIRRADTWGRRKMLMVTILGYTLFTMMSGLALNVYMFAVCQFAARIFLIGEWLVSMIYAAEEFPADRRGMVIGVIQGFSSLGAVVCAGLAPLLLKTALGWRLIYLVGVIPLLLLAFARRNIRETERFEHQDPNEIKEEKKNESLFAIFKTPYRNRMLLLAAVWCLTYACTNNAITFWKEYAIADLKLTKGQVGLTITIGAIVSMPLVFFAGKLLDVMGRKMGATLIYLTTVVGVVGVYTMSGKALLIGSMILAIFGVSAVLPVMNAFSTELFPTDIRASAFSWANNLLGRLGYVFAPLAIGYAADPRFLGFGWGKTMSLIAILPLIALGIIVFFLPETKGRSLEETSAL